MPRSQFNACSIHVTRSCLPRCLWEEHRQPTETRWSPLDLRRFLPCARGVRPVTQLLPEKRIRDEHDLRCLASLPVEDQPDSFDERSTQP